MSVTRDDARDKDVDTAEVEDIPSDFFDDFTKEEFIQGLSVVDSWNDDEACRKRGLEELNCEAHQQDGKELQLDHRNSEEKFSTTEENCSENHNDSAKRRSTSNSKMDDYIKPGSRRDPKKTKEAIRRDKEVKVKEHLAKHLESTDEIRPPGTELDDFFSSEKNEKKSKPTYNEEDNKISKRSRSKDRHRKKSPKQRRASSKSRRESPKYKYDSRLKYNHREEYQSPRFISKYNKSWRSSPVRRIRRHSPLHFSSREYSPRRLKSRSPDHTRPIRSRRSRSPINRDKFSYPRRSKSPVYKKYDASPLPYTGMASTDFSIPSFLYNQNQVYTGGYSGYDGYAQPVQPVNQPVSIPSMDPVGQSVMGLSLPPPMVPPPSTVTSENMEMTSKMVEKKYDALAQLVADGKLSQTDYLKLAPNKGGTLSMDDKTRVKVLCRCDEAINKLHKLLLPNRLLINNNILRHEPKSIMPAYCSPLKRQPTVEFQFTKASSMLLQRQNKQLLDSIVSSIGLEKSFSRVKKKTKDTRDIAIQTMKPYCDVCDIRDSLKFNNVATSIDLDLISSSVHTQVLEQDLLNSKSVFNPSGSGGISGPISIAHLTPAQLVSQLAARAKTLKQTDNFRRNPPNNYDGRGGEMMGGRDYYNNYRY